MASAAGKVAFVTGSTQGIGLSIAKLLANEGCNIILTGLATPDQIEAAKKEVQMSGAGVKVDFVSGDLRDVADINKMVSEIFNLHPDGVDILVNNAGFQHVCYIEEYPEDKWNDMVAVMLSAPFHLTKRFIPSMKKKGWGRIVNMSSQMGYISTHGKAAYSAVKTGLIGLTKGLALEVAEHGITCNAICPTFAWTELVEKQIPKVMNEKGVSYEEAKAVFSDPIPVKQMITTEQIADFVKYLCFSAASPLMTGVAYLLDGGYTAQ